MENLLAQMLVPSAEFAFMLSLALFALSISVIAHRQKLKPKKITD